MIVNRAIFCIFDFSTTNNDPKIHRKCVFSKGTCPTNPGTHFLGKKKRLRQDAWGIVLVQMTSKFRKMLKSLISVDLGTVLGGLGRFPRRKIMIGVWPTQLDGFWGPIM